MKQHLIFFKIEFNSHLGKQSLGCGWQWRFLVCSGDRRSRENKLLDVGRRSKSCKTKTVCTWTLRTDKHKGFHLSQTLLLIVLTCSLFGVPQFKNQVEVFLTYIQDNKKTTNSYSPMCISFVLNIFSHSMFQKQ